MPRLGCCLFIALFNLLPLAIAQTEEEAAKSILPVDPLLLPLSGFQIYNVTIYSGYSSSPWLSGASQFSQSPLGADFSGGVSGSMGWNWFRGRTTASITYSSAYDTGFRYSDLNAFSQAASVTFRKILTPRWSLSTAAVFSDTTANQLFFPLLTNTTEANAAQVSDPNATGSNGTVTPAVLPGGQPALQNSPLSMFVYGNRSRSASDNTNLTFKKSARLAMSFGGSFAWAESIDTSATSRILVPRSLATRAYFNLFYNISTKTAVGLSVDGQRELAPQAYGNAWTESIAGNVNRTLARHWRTEAHAGLGLIQWLSPNGPSSKSTTVIAGGGVVYATQTQSVRFSYDRSIANSYGYIVGTSDNFGASWAWRRSPRSWAVLLSTSYERAGGPSYANLYGITASAGLTKTVGRHMAASLQYVYAHNAGAIQSFYLPNFQGVRLSLSWRGLPVAH